MNRALEIAELLDKVLARGKRQPPATKVLLREVWAEVLGLVSDSPDFQIAMAANSERAILLREDLVQAQISERSRGLFQNALAELWPFDGENRGAGE